MSELELKLENNALTDVICPHCGAQMRIKTRRSDGRKFLGCSGWPDCYYVRGIPEEWKMRAAGQVGLFNGQNGGAL